jgi:demethylmenaquinone methyltransferase/2-methoxy-6-polyprenyl-1,4-benzoquinol methylase
MPLAAARTDHGQWARRNRRMFAGIARRYDLANKLISLGHDGHWRREAAAAAAPGRVGLALDVATGTGDVGFELLERADRVVGVDLTPAMLEKADDKARTRGAGDRFQLAVADGLRLPFADGTFDCATNAFALRNFADPALALSEMRRVVRPGGRVVSLELTRPRSSMLRLAHRAYMEGLVPLIGGAASGGHVRAYWYLPTSVHRMVPAEELAEVMRRVGFSRVTYRLYNMQSIAIHVAEV